MTNKYLEKIAETRDVSSSLLGNGKDLKGGARTYLRSMGEGLLGTVAGAAVGGAAGAAFGKLRRTSAIMPAILGSSAIGSAAGLAGVLRGAGVSAKNQINEELTRAGKPRLSKADEKVFSRGARITGRGTLHSLPTMFIPNRVAGSVASTVGYSHGSGISLRNQMREELRKAYKL